MIFRYGNYSHAMNEVGFRATAKGNFDEYGRLDSVTHSWVMRGMIFGDDIDDLTTNLRALEAAYSLPNQRAGLYKNDGSTATIHVINPNQTMGGVRVVSFDYPEDGIRTAEYSTFRTFEVVIEFEKSPSRHGQIVSFEESVEFIGGGERVLFVDVIKGPPVRQVTSEQTAYTAIQSGTMISYNGYASLPTKLWPGDFIANESRTRRDNPLVRVSSPTGQGFYYNYAQSWSWVYRSATPFTGNPHLPATF